MQVGIINYGVGNIGSVICSVNNLGYNYKIIEKETDFTRHRKL